MRWFSLFLFLIGVSALIGALAWWFLFWRAVVARLGGNLLDAVPCLAIENSTYCGAINLVGDISGKAPYEPLLLWAGFLLVLLSVLMRLGAQSRRKDSGR